jgi:hypothetical protein
VYALNAAFRNAMDNIVNVMATSQSQLIRADPNMPDANSISQQLNALVTTFTTGVSKIKPSDI